VHNRNVLLQLEHYNFGRAEKPFIQKLAWGLMVVKTERLLFFKRQWREKNNMNMQSTLIRIVPLLYF